MEITLDLIDNVVQYKGRVWTIHSVSTGQGVFAYQGLKPFASFDYHKDSQRYSTFKKNTIYIKQDEITILTGDDIQSAVKKEQSEIKKKLTRKKAIDFYVYLTGHSRAFVTKKIDEGWHSFGFTPGAVRYRLWKHERGEHSFLLLSHNMKGTESHVYYDFITFETDDLELERSWEAVKQEIIDGYKEWNSIQ